MKRLASSKSSRKASSISNDEIYKNATINEQCWTCSVALVVERNPDMKKYIKYLEDGIKGGGRPVVKLINAKELEASGNKGSSAAKLTSKSNKGPQGQLAAAQNNTNKITLTAEKIVKSILKSKSEDMIKMNHYNNTLEKCEAFLNNQVQSKQKTASVETEIVYDEPSCGPSLYFVLTGFYEPELVLELLRLKVPLEVVLGFAEVDTVDQTDARYIQKNGWKSLKMDPCESFWSGYDDLMKNWSNFESTSNLIVVTSNINQIYLGKENLKPKDLTVLTYDLVCKTLFQIQIEKRKYIDFIVNLDDVEVESVGKLTISKMPLYKECIGSLPIEITTIDHIIDGIIKQIESDTDSLKTGSIGENDKSSSSIYGEQTREGSKVSLSSKSSPDVIEGIVPFSNGTPFLIEHNNKMNFDFRNYQDIYEEIKDYHYVILEGLICPALWRWFPYHYNKASLLAEGHFQKLQKFYKIKDRTVLEASIHKRLFNKIILSTIDNRNIDAITQDVFNGYCGCGLNLSSSCGLEEEEDLQKSTESQSIYPPDGKGNEFETTLFDSSFLRFSREILDLHAEEEEEKRLSATSSKINELIMKNHEELDELKNFLSCPALDNLFMECYETMIEHNILEIYSRETCLCLLNRYSSVYDNIDFVYCNATDCIVFVFHNNINDEGLSKHSLTGYLLTATGFRDYYNVLNKKLVYRNWIDARSEALERENELLMENFKVSVTDKDRERCCFRKIKKYGIFPLEENSKLEYKNHAPLPPLKFIRDDHSNFVSYNMGISSHIHFGEDVSSFLSKSGTKITRKLFNSFNKVDSITQVMFKHSACSICFNISSEYQESEEFKREIACETEDGIRIVFVYNKRALDPNLNGNNKKNTKRNSTNSESTSYYNTVDEKSFEGRTIITLSNGLEVTPYQIDGKVWGVKQRHLEMSSRTPGNREKYRIYLKDGTIMVFKEDGTVKAYYSDSTVTDIIRISSEKEFATICGDEIVNKKRSGSNQTPESNAKEIHHQSKEIHYVIGEHEVTSWSGYVSYYKYDFCWQTVGKFYLRTAYEPGQELFTSRTDGTMTFLNSNGELFVQFEDGSRITSSPREITELYIFYPEEALPYEEDDTDEDWTMFDLDFVMEEPTNYLPVSVQGDCWTVTLPGDKTFCFKDLDFATVKLNNSKLSVDYEKGEVLYRTFDEDTMDFSSYSVYFSPSDLDIVSKFSDEDVTFTVTFLGETALKESQFFEDENAADYFKANRKNMQRFSSGLTVIPGMFDYFEMDQASKQEDVESMYAIKPNEYQRDYKLVYIKRDLTGYELIKESDHSKISESGATSSTGDSLKTQYKKGKYNISVRHLEIGDDITYPPTKVAYTNPEAFTKTCLQRNNLTKYLNRSRVWLLDTSEQNALSKVFAPIRTSMRASSSIKYHYSIVEKASTYKAVVIIRKYVDLNEFVNFERKLQEALDQYLNFKRDIYAAILKNTIDDVTLKRETCDFKSLKN